VEKFGSICHFCHFRHTNTLEVQIAVRRAHHVGEAASYIYLYVHESTFCGFSKIFFQDRVRAVDLP
jgi:hypothetical protein